MYNIEFYEDSNGKSELWKFLESLRIKAATNKDARIQYKQISLYIQLLEDNGTRLNENITKHLDDDIWELRPGNPFSFLHHIPHIWVENHNFQMGGKILFWVDEIVLFFQFWVEISTQNTKKAAMTFSIITASN